MNFHNTLFISLFLILFTCGCNQYNHSGFEELNAIGDVNITGNLIIGGNLTGKSGVKAYVTGSPQSLADSNWETILLNETDYDTLGEFDKTQSTFNVTQTGTYMITSSIRTSPIADGKNLQAGITINGIAAETGLVWMGAAGAPQVTISFAKRLATGDAVGMRARHTSGGPETVNTGNLFTYLIIQRMD